MIVYMKIERIAEKIIQSSYEIEVCLYSRSIKRCQKLIIFWISFSGKRLNFEGSLQSNQTIGDFGTSKLTTICNILTFFQQKKRDLRKTLGSPCPTTGLGYSSDWHRVAHHVQNLFCLLFSSSKRPLQVAPLSVGETTVPSGGVLLKY